MKTKRISINSDIYFYYIIFNLHLYLYFWSSLRAATMERSVFLAWNLQGCFLFGIVWGQDRPMVCGRLPWNALDFWLETFRVFPHLVLFEARRVPWFAGGYHGTFLIVNLVSRKCLQNWGFLISMYYLGTVFYTSKHDEISMSFSSDCL